MEKSFNNELSALQRFICNIVASAAVICCGIFLLLVGLGVVPFMLKDVALPSILFTIGFIFVVTAFVQKNSVSLWLSFFFSVPAVIVLLVNYIGQLSYSNMYPFFIAIPAFASFFTLIFSKEYRSHITTIVFFGVLTILFSLKSFGIAGWGAVLPGVIIFIGAIILFYALNRRNDL